MLRKTLIATAAVLPLSALPFIEMASAADPAANETTTEAPAGAQETSPLDDVGRAEVIAPGTIGHPVIKDPSQPWVDFYSGGPDENPSLTGTRREAIEAYEPAPLDGDAEELGEGRLTETEDAESGLTEPDTRDQVQDRQTLETEEAPLSTD